MWRIIDILYINLQGANDKHGDEDVDYEYSDENSADGASSRFKQFNMGATSLSVLLYTLHKITVCHLK